MYRLVIGMSGASGAIYGIRLLQVLKEMPDVETHVVLSQAARETIALETDWRPKDVEALADTSHRIGDVAASIASGSFTTDGMVIAPCSMGTISAVAQSSNDNLLTRAADVALKERRPLILLARETPLHLGHLRLMVQLAEMGALICPPVPAFYRRPKSVDELVDHTVGRVLDLLPVKLEHNLVRRWAGGSSAQ